jgi:hypothetical protein
MISAAFEVGNGLEMGVEQVERVFGAYLGLNLQTTTDCYPPAPPQTVDRLEWVPEHRLCRV